MIILAMYNSTTKHVIAILILTEAEAARATREVIRDCFIVSKGT